MTGMKYLNLTPHSGNTFLSKYVYLPPGGRIILGRATESNPGHPSNGLFPREMSISLNHAEIWYEDGKVFIQDLGSEQGTSVNYSPIRRPTLISNGDIVVRTLPDRWRASSDVSQTLGGVMMKVAIA
ncbi:hypothetical protein BJ322DRAFT_74656 [Thelephora terrestris]|uniref:FHA domain-containing protein n=1 Tax=Thelephora terrestris TaxID=56493 RepID=A0A9P6LCH3_9AGAM|nr:hypothetical protein BJ322DRAFT_74656 [Thelephora terrestris]